MDNNNLYWVRDTNTIWKKCVLEEIDENYMYFTLENSKKIKFLKKDKKQYLLRNSDEEDKCPNLTSLIHLNAASILNNINLRYIDDNIYTFNDNILLAINPFKNLDIYNINIINECYNNVDFKKPHPYLIGKLAYINLKENNKNQTILVSGESGAGKTQTTKYIMNYISSTSYNKINNIERKILACNPILEAFGNAKTIKNDNSSRFGKFIKLLFDKNYILVGGEINNYLLEKIRLTSLSKDERNFHIFYILIKSLDKSKKEELNLDDNIDFYNYLNKSNIINRDDGVNDIDLYNELIESFNILNFSKNELDHIFKIISFILNLGNIDETDNDNKYLNNCCSLIQIEKKNLIDILENRYLNVNNEIIIIKNKKEEMYIIRDTISQILYDLLFDFIVKKINNIIKSDYSYYIGILDIFGFEVFEENGFEQLSINYTNEKLQNLFNKYIFELEQIEYNKENIDWKNIDYPNNNAIVNLFENKKDGIFSLLTEQCILKSGNDNQFYDTLTLNLEKNDKITIEKSDIVFKKLKIHHYAGIVPYTINNFVEKNKNIYDDRLNELFINSSNIIIKELDFNINNVEKGKNNFIINNFKLQLNHLLDQINLTKQHYIRCIKPNDINIFNEFNRIRVYEQLKYCGVLEAIKIARAGYPIRIKKNLFIDEFYTLMNSLKINLNDNNIHKLIVYYINDNKNLFQIGNSKIFMKREVYEEICNKKKEILILTCIKIQKEFKRFIYQKKYKNFKKILINLQLKWKKYINEKKNCIKIQSIVRKFISRNRMIKIKSAHNIIYNNFYSNYLRKKYLKFKSSTTYIQGIIRMNIQKNIFINLKITTSSVSKIENQFIRYKNRLVILKNLKNIISLNKKNELLENELKELRKSSNFEKELMEIKKQNDIMSEIMKEDFENSEHKYTLLETEFDEITEKNKQLENNIKNSDNVISEKEIMIEKLLIENSKLKKIQNKNLETLENKSNENKKNLHVTDIEANYELAQKMEDLYLKLSIAEEQLQNKTTISNKSFFDFIKSIF